MYKVPKQYCNVLVSSELKIKMNMAIDQKMQTLIPVSISNFWGGCLLAM